MESSGSACARWPFSPRDFEIGDHHRDRRADKESPEDKAMANIIAFCRETAEALVRHPLQGFDELVERQGREERIFHDPVIGGPSGIIAADAGVGDESARILACEGGEFVAPFADDAASRRRQSTIRHADCDRVGDKGKVERHRWNLSLAETRWPAFDFSPICPGQSRVGDRPNG